MTKQELRKYVDEYIDEAMQFSDPPQFFKGSRDEYQRLIEYILSNLLRTVEA